MKSCRAPQRRLRDGMMVMANTAASIPPAKDDWAKKVETSLRGPVLAASVIVGVGLGGFLVWASTAQLSGAVMASGNVAANGENQTIQHLEGGIVKEIMVKDGRIGCRRSAIDSARSDTGGSQSEPPQKTIAVLGADEVRLLAELSDSETFDLPPALLGDAPDPGLKSFIQSKKSEFELRTLRYRNEVSILEQRLGGLHEEIAGTEAQRVAIRKQMVLTREELRDIEYLIREGPGPSVSHVRHSTVRSRSGGQGRGALGVDRKDRPSPKSSSRSRSSVTIAGLKPGPSSRRRGPESPIRWNRSPPTRVFSPASLFAPRRWHSRTDECQYGRSRHFARASCSGTPSAQRRTRCRSAPAAHGYRRSSSSDAKPAYV